MSDLKLDKFQEEAIHAAASGHSVIVSAPTGAGKTLIAERIIEDCIRKNKGVIYTAPIKALSNQKYRDFCRQYPEKTGILTGDVSINRDAPILIMTTEIFRNAIMVNPEEFAHREWVIFDEIHYLDDIERGTVWEEAIILLPKAMKMLALSATLPNINEFTDWLGKVHNFPLKVIIEKNRPVPLHFMFQCNNEIFANFDELKKGNVLRADSRHKLPYHVYSRLKYNRMATLVDYIKKRNAAPCLYFAFSRRRCEELAQEVSYQNFLSDEERERIILLFGDLAAKFNLASGHANFLFSLVKRGIAYHHAGLLPTLKEIIEQLFASGLIKLIFTTETFALGINMPAKTVVFDTVSKFYGRGHAYLKVRDLYQMAGRAGRRGIDTEGYVIIKASPHACDLAALQNMMYGSYEPITSQLNSCYATILNLYKIMGDKIYDIYPRSFHFHQSSPSEKKEAVHLLGRKMTLLESLRYIADGSITWKADLASKVYSFELQMGELFENGFWETLSGRELFTIITAMVYEPRKGDEKPEISRSIRRFKKDLNKFVGEIHREERRLRIFPLSKKFYFYLSAASDAWFDGVGFDRLEKICGVDEGEIVRNFRMSIQVLREMLTSQIISESLKVKIVQCLRKVNRDVVDAEKQLRQEL